MLGRETRRRETERDDPRDERPGARDSERLQEGLSLALALLATAWFEVRSADERRDDEAGLGQPTSGGTTAGDVAASLRDRVTPGGTGASDDGVTLPVDGWTGLNDRLTGPSDGWTGSDVGWRELTTRLADATDGWTADLPDSVRTAATDERVRRGAPVAGALLAGALLAGRSDDEASTAGAARDEASAAGTADDEGGLSAAVSRVRRRLASGAGTLAGGETASEAGTASGSGPASGGIGRGEGDAMMEGGDATTGGDDVTTGEGDALAATGIDADVRDLSAPSTGGMPMLGVGTYRRADYDECLDTVRQALQVGYRHVDTTDRRSGYYAEEAVGDAVAESGADREDVFVATKVTPADLDHVRTSAEESLDRLGMEYVDLLYVHWPTHDYEPHETLAAFADLREEGLVDRIGVSNFTVDLLEEALDVTDAPIFANQVEMHPLLPQTELREFCEDAGVEVVAYSPIARGHVEDVDELREVAEKHGATPEQVSLAWLREKGVAAIPRATSEDHLRENWRSLALDLDAEDVRKLDSIDERRRIVDPEDAPWN